jgi:TonB family protein
MIEQEPVASDELPPDDSPQGTDEPTADLGTGLIGDGPNSFGLTAGGGARRGSRQIGARAGASRWGWYAARVQNTVSSTLASHPTTRNATLSIQVRIWADRNGRVVRAQLVNSSGDRSLDEVIRNQILNGMMLPDPPPDDMPMPINLRISARKP